MVPIDPVILKEDLLRRLIALLTNFLANFDALVLRFLLSVRGHTRFHGYDFRKRIECKDFPNLFTKISSIISLVLGTKILWKVLYAPAAIFVSGTGPVKDFYSLEPLDLKIKFSFMGTLISEQNLI